jgi:4-amino-4-deoxy-L-arabinose transferase-like glycosyltransferase
MNQISTSSLLRLKSYAQPESKGGIEVVFSQIAKLLFVFLCVEAYFSISYRGVFLITHSLLLSWAAVVIVFIFIAICYRFRDLLLKAMKSFFPERWVQSCGWLWSCVAIGLLLRLAWVLSFPTTLKADGIAYYDVAASMTKGSYTGVFWPPGLPIVLTPFMMVFGTHPWVTILVSLLLFMATCSVTWMLARELSGRITAGISVAILAFWPGYLTIVGINSKEGLIAFLLPAAMLLYLRSFRNPRRNWALLAGFGILIGFATLTQPACILFPFVIILTELIRRANFRTALKRTVVFGLGMLIMILPWTYRNEHVVGHFILVTVNGGSVFYRANNPLANASYSPEGTIHLPDDVYEANRIGYAEGKKWILHHPGAFVVLAVRKQIVYLGDDGIGVYETLKRGLRPSEALYGGAKAICSAYWLMLWIILLMACPRVFSTKRWWMWYGLCFLPVTYQWAIDTVFESGSRHHISDVALLAILVGHALSAEKDSPTLEG